MNNEDFAKMLETFSLLGNFAGGPYGGMFQKELSAVKPILDSIAGTADLTGYSPEGDNSLEEIRSKIASHKTVEITKAFAEYLIDKDPEIFDEKELIIVEKK